MLVQFYNVSKVYKNGVKALNDISLKIDRGEFIFLMGPSGAGKSTLLHVLGGLDAPTGGTVWFKGQDLYRLPAGRRTDLRP